MRTLPIKLPLGTLGKYQSDLYYCKEFPDGILAKEYDKLKKRAGDAKKKHYNFAYKRTINGAITTMFNTQASNSKGRNHKPPTYTTLDLFNWIMAQPNVVALFSYWVKKGHKMIDKPSPDRIYYKQGYSLQNLTLMTWGENNAKSREDQKSGKLFDNHTPVIMLTKDGKPEREFISQSQAAEYLRAEGYPKADGSAICNCCKGKLKTAYKHKWQYKIL